jgi:hypothetical protein
MLRAFLFPIMASLTCLLLQVVVARGRGIPAGDHPEFRFSLGIRIFCWLGVFAVTVLPMAFGPWHSALAKAQLFAFGALAILGFACCIWTEKFRLKFWDDHLTYGAFKACDVYYADIISSGIRIGGGGKRFLVIKTAKKRIAINGYLGSFDGAALLLENKLRSLSRG